MAPRNGMAFALRKAPRANKDIEDGNRSGIEGGSVMKNLLSRVMVLIVLGLCAVAVQAQTGSTLYANVPFSFSIGDKYMESGQYSIKMIASNVERWKNESGESNALIQTISKETMGDLNHARLVFRFDGTQYVLCEVWTDVSAYELPGTHKHNRKLASTQNEKVIALLSQPAMK